jgi:hypothetical protein
MRLIVALFLVLSLSACISPTSFIDPALPVLRHEDLQPVAQPQPVQLLYEFRTKGAPNAAATGHTKATVAETVTKSGLFSSVSETPVASGRTLALVIENVEVTKDAASKGFATGLTFGLVGTMVTDGYICTATYSAPGAKPKSASVNHALHTSIGNTTPPPNLKPMTPAESIPIVVQQLTLNALQALRKDGL